VIVLRCQQCGKEFSRYPSQIKIGRSKFCSVKCKAEWQKTNLKGGNNPNFGNHPKAWNKGLTKEDVRVIKYSLKLRGRKINAETIRKMSHSLRGRLAPNKGIPHSEEAKKKMSLRKRELVSRGWKPVGFHGSAWNKGKTKESDEKIRKIAQKLSLVKKRLFSQGLIQPNKPWLGCKPWEHPNWRGGISFEPYAPEFNDSLKAYIKRRDCYRCQLCGCTKNLVVHHIDYDKKNNFLTNLISLCRNCHAQTNFRREDWIKYFKEREHGNIT